MNQETHLRHLDLFAGVGMFALAARWAGIETVAFSEVDPTCNEILQKQFPQRRNLGDVRKLCRRAHDCEPEDEIGEVWCPRCEAYFGECACVGTDEFTDEHGWPDIVTAGFPCQGVSVDGKGKGIDDPRSALWLEPVRIACELRPTFLQLENVPALRTRGADTILSTLEAIGYAAQPFVVGASNVRGEHRRKRVWIVAYDTTQRIQGLRPERIEVAHSLAEPFLPLRSRDGEWQVEPDVRRAVDGDAFWMDRVACIGNAVCPQVPVMFFDWMREVTRKERYAAT
jgi:DNA (cytosine-5)-methyltransferase 1